MNTSVTTKIVMTLSTHLKVHTCKFFPIKHSTSLDTYAMAISILIFYHCSQLPPTFMISGEYWWSKTIIVLPIGIDCNCSMGNRRETRKLWLMQRFLPCIERNRCLQVSKTRMDSELRFSLCSKVKFYSYKSINASSVLCSSMLIIW